MCTRKNEKLPHFRARFVRKGFYFLDVMSPHNFSSPPPPPFILLSSSSPPRPPLNLPSVLRSSRFLLSRLRYEVPQRLHLPLHPSFSSFIILLGPHPPLSSCPPSPFSSRVFYTIYFFKLFVQNCFYSIFFVALTKMAFLCLHARSLVEYRAVGQLHRQQQQQQRRRLYYNRLISPSWSVMQYA